LDGESILQEISRLEDRVDRLIGAYEALVEESVQLRTRVETLEGEVREKVEAENRLNEERALVRSRIDGLLAKLQEQVKGPVQGQTER